MRLDERTRDAIKTAIRAHLGENVEEIHVQQTTDNTGDQQVRIEIVISAQHVDAEMLASRFFGLTRRVRDAMGEDYEEVFPVIRPVASAHA